MRGVILAGGSGSRMFPLTKVTNKHLLPVGRKPMIYYPIETLHLMGITDVMIILGGNSVGDVVNLLGNGDQFNMNFTYKYQDGALGIAHAVSLAEDFVGNDTFSVILGDNIFSPEPSFIQNRMRLVETVSLGCIYLTNVEEPQRFGVVEWKDPRAFDRQIHRIIEKPKDPPSSTAVTGLYMYHRDVFDFIKALKPSARGEYEITDLHNILIGMNALTYVEHRGFWSDAGTFESLQRASNWANSTYTQKG